MTNTISFSIDNRNFVSMPRREGVVIDSITSPSNEGSEQNFITAGGATLVDFVVALARNRVYFFARAPRNQTQGRSLQLERILY